VFRAHEVAHQWFGIGIDYATYRDRWLSEGFSDFAGLWYMQNRKSSTDKYFAILTGWRSRILERRREPIPIWLGHRVATATTGDDYSTIVYQKGAWTLHMLRMLLLDLKTMNEDRFTNVMREYYTSFAGKAASTDDFQQVVERQTGQKMDWFFNQWVRASAVPTYRVATKTEEADGKFRVKLRVTQEQVPEDFLMYVPVGIELDNKQTVRLRVKVTGARSEIDLPPLPAKPRAIRFNDLEGVLAEVKNEGW
jgi:aminopeptidase N